MRRKRRKSKNTTLLLIGGVAVFLYLKHRRAVAAAEIAALPDFKPTPSSIGLTTT